MHGGFAAVAYPTRRLFEFPLGWLATGPTERLLGAVLASIPDQTVGLEENFEIGRFGTPKGRYFEICLLMGMVTCPHKRYHTLC